MRVEITRKFIHKLKSKYNNIKIYEADERLTTVQAQRTMNYLDVKKGKKKSLVDTISASLILENFINSNRKWKNVKNILYKCCIMKKYVILLFKKWKIFLRRRIYKWMKN